ncbi:MAG TPA: hypothetical protein VKE96_11965 [Vicinamibacterales bacterium]|nr:hypothetical protein [Vicinamibacterales bacterium]
MTAFSEASALLERALDGPVRQHLVSDLARSRPFGKALARLREHIRFNTLEPFLSPFDHRTRQEGFHVLHDWDGNADHVSDEIIPVDVLDYLARLRGGEASNAAALAMLLDYYYFHVLQLLSLRIWDEGDADANLDRLADLLGLLQGSGGGGQPFVADAETLILIATSHFEEVERGYARLLRRVKTLDHAHQVRVAIGHASSMGCHLRFGFEATYRRDTVKMRDDNVADYPWLCFALATLMLEYARLRDAGVDADGRDAIVEAMVSGLSPDARAFLGAAPQSLVPCDPEREAFRDSFFTNRSELVREFERHRPVDGVYSPLSFFFNFSHNVLKGTIVDALLRGEPWKIAFNEMLSGITVRLKPDTTAASAENVAAVSGLSRTNDAAGVSGSSRTADRERLARTLMEYARANPDRISGRLMPVIVYDPRAGHRAFRVMMEKIAMANPSRPNPPSP